MKRNVIMVVGIALVVAWFAWMLGATHKHKVSDMETRFLYCFKAIHDASWCYEHFIGL
jgi:hypothetical protein